MQSMVAMNSTDNSKIDSKSFNASVLLELSEWAKQYYKEQEDFYGLELVDIDL